MSRNLPKFVHILVLWKKYGLLVLATIWLSIGVRWLRQSGLYFRISEIWTA